MGFADNIEYGPGRHGPGLALFVYMRDPDGHRIELFNTHYQCMDIEDEPVRYDIAPGFSENAWGYPAPKSWVEEGSFFPDIKLTAPKVAGMFANAPVPVDA